MPAERPMTLTSAQHRLLTTLQAGGTLILCEVRKIGAREMEYRAYLQQENGFLETCRVATVLALVKQGAIEEAKAPVRNLGGGWNKEYRLTEAGREAQEGQPE